jgi:hypothetical protein
LMDSQQYVAVHYGLHPALQNPRYLGRKPAFNPPISNKFL